MSLYFDWRLATTSPKLSPAALVIMMSPDTLASRNNDSGEGDDELEGVGVVSMPLGDTCLGDDDTNGTAALHEPSSSPSEEDNCVIDS